MTIHEAIGEFRAAAIAKADFAAPASRDHALHKRMADAFEFLSAQGSDGHIAFIALLHDESSHVRGWVAAQLLSDGDETAVPVMEQLAAESGIRGFTAETTLKEFRAGRLRSPFTSHAA
jgi:phage-related baseplate assembly protein